MQVLYPETKNRTGGATAPARLQARAFHCARVPCVRIEATGMRVCWARDVYRRARVCRGMCLQARARL